MPRRSACTLAFAILASVAHAQFPLGPGNNPPQPIVDPAINEYISKSVVRHAMLRSPRQENLQVELVSSRWQGELVFVFSRVCWTAKPLWGGALREHVVEVQYSMIQRRFRRCVYEIWCTATKPTVYQYYDLGRVRTRINEELYRFDQIAGDNVFPGPWPRGPATMVPQISTPPSTPSPGAKKSGEPVKEVIEPIPPPTIVIPPVVEPRPQFQPPPPQTPPSSTGKDRLPPPQPMPPK